MENSNYNHFYFFKTLIEFLNDLETVYQSQSQKIQVLREKYNIPRDINENKITEFNQELIESFAKTFSGIQKELMRSELDLTKEIVLFEQINLSEIMKLPETTSDIKNAIYKYLQTLYLFSKNDPTAFDKEMVEKLLKSMKPGSVNISDESVNIAKKSLHEMLGINENSTKEQKAMMNMINDVTDEITSVLKNETMNPMELLMGLMNPESKGGMNKLAESISAKMETNMGDLDENELEKQAQEMFGNLNNGLMEMLKKNAGEGNGNGNGDQLQQILQSLGGGMGNGMGNGMEGLLSKLGSNPSSLMDGMQKGMKLMDQMDKLDKIPVKKSKTKGNGGRTNKHKKKK